MFWGDYFAIPSYNWLMPKRFLMIKHKTNIDILIKILANQNALNYFGNQAEGGSGYVQDWYSVFLPQRQPSSTEDYI